MAIGDKKESIAQPYGEPVTSQCPHKGQREAWNYHLLGHSNCLLKASYWDLAKPPFPAFMLVCPFHILVIHQSHLKFTCEKISVSNSTVAEA